MIERLGNAALILAIALSLGACSIVGIFGGMYMLARQALRFLKSGTWESMSVADGLHEIGGSHFLMNWVGVAKILGAIPLPIFLIFAGALASALLTAFNDRETFSK